MDYKIGLDLGIASVGWAVLQTDKNGEPIRIENLGSRIFDKAENPKDGSSLASQRREARGVRRRLRRRKHRRDRVLSLLEMYNIITKQEVLYMFNNKEYKFLKNVYELRVEGLETLLTPKELARVLINLVKRRGYKSNSIAQEKSDKQLGKLLTATIENDKIMKENNYKTVAQMYLNDPRFIQTDNFYDGRKVLKIRNGTNVYKSTVRREDLVKEIKLILEKQKELNPKITDDFIKKYLEIFNSQRSFEDGPGENSPYGGNQIEKMIGNCTFEKNEPRAVKAAYTFEYFKILQDLNHIKIESRVFEDGKYKTEYKLLSKEQKDIIISIARKSDTISFDKIKKALKLDVDTKFNMVNYNVKKDLNIEDVIAESEKSTKLKEFQSYHKIRKCLDKLEKGLVEKLSIDTLDNIGYILSVYKNDESKKNYLKANCKNLNDKMIESLLQLTFSKTCNLSLKAIKKLIPYLQEGMTYDKAVDKVYGKDVYVNTKRKTRISFNDIKDEITNPVVKRAVSQAIKVVNTIVNKYGKPDSINIELSRDISKSFSERKKIEKQYNDNRVINEKAKKEIQELGKLNVTGQDIIKYKLWKEQDEVCMYSGYKITPDELFTELVDIDHIVPYSISFDDSFNNKVLVLSSENRKKGNRVPLQYFRENNKNTDEYETRITNTYLKHNNIQKLKKLQIENISKEREDEFKRRNLVDTQYLSRLMQNILRNNLAFSDKTNIKLKVQSVKGTITAHVRKRLGIEKNRADGDIHHAIDAAIIAIVTPRLIQKVTNFYKYKENKKLYNMTDEEKNENIENFRKYVEPYKGFTEELNARSIQNENLLHEALKKLKYLGYNNIDGVKPIFVSRMPRRKVTGAVHKDTIRGIDKKDNVYYSVSKVPITSLKLTKDKQDIEGYKDKQKRDDIYLYNALLERLIKFDGDAKEAFKEPFYKPNKYGKNGAVVKKVKIEEKISSFVTLNNGKSLAANGPMIRIDVFFVQNDGYYFVPIYTKDVIEKVLPDKACVANKPETYWKEMKDSDFIFSLYPNDLISIQTRSPLNLVSCKDLDIATLTTDNLMCYFNSADISSGAIKIKTHDNKYECRLGIKTLINFKKYQVDILGDYYEVKLPEKRVDFRNMKGGKKA